MPTGERIELIFEYFRLERQATCNYDYLAIYDGKGSTSDQIGKKLCGSTIPSKKMSTGNEMHLEWRSDGTRSFRGFKIKVIAKGNTTKKIQYANNSLMI